MAMAFGKTLAVGTLVAVVLLSGGTWPELGPERDAASTPTKPLGLRADVASLPLGFVENRGQLANEAVRYRASAGRTQFGFAPGAVLVALGGSDGRGVLLRAVFDDANLVPPEGHGPMSMRTHYFQGRDPAVWRTNVPSFSEVHYPRLYEGIDLVYRVAPEGVKYDFLVAAGADPGAIRIAYEGAERVAVDASGDLVVETSLGAIRDTRPIGTQSGKEVSCGFVLRGLRTVGFECPGRDPTRPLVIDPLLYATYLGGTVLDFGRAVTVDTAGNVYVTGDVNSTDFPTTPGAFDRTLAGTSFDAFVAKFDASGSALVWATFLGGSGMSDVGLAIAVDGAGSVYVGGQTDSPDFPVTNGSHDVTLAGPDGFVVKLGPAGDTLVWGTFLGGIGGEVVRAVVLDGGGNVYTAGLTQSPDFPTTAGVIGPTYGGGFLDGFVSAIDATGTSLLFSTYLGGLQADTAEDLARDAAGNLYVVGGASSGNFPTTPGAFDETLGGASDGYLAKLNPTATAFLYATFLGGSSDNEGAFAVAIDSAGEAYVAGVTNGIDFPTTPGAFDVTYGDRTDFFVTKVNATGSGLVYSTYIGGLGEDSLPSLRVDAAGRAYLSGRTNSLDFPITADATYPTYGGGQYDTFALKLNATGTGIVYGTYLGGSRSDEGEDLAIDASGVYLVGSTDSTDFPATGGSYDPTPNGAYDGFVAKLSLGHLITLDTAPTGLQVEVDGTPYGTPYTIDCEPNSTLLLHAPSPQTTADTRYGFVAWSDAGAQTHAITCSAPETYVATFVPTEYRTVVHTDPQGLQVDVDASPFTTPYTFWCAAGSSPVLTATSPQGAAPTVYVFLQWSDSGAQSHAIACTAPREYTAMYDTQHQVIVGTSPQGLDVLVDGLTGTAPVTVWWSEGSPHTLEAPSPQVIGPTQYVFAAWSDGGPRQHTVIASGPGTYTATFATQHTVTVSTAPTGLQVTVGGLNYTAPHTLWCDEGTVLSIGAPSPQGAGTTRFAFDAWSDAGAQTHAVTCSAPETYVARFRTEHRTIVDSLPASRQVEVNGTVFTAPFTFWCIQGFPFTLHAPSPQEVGTTRFVFLLWSDTGAQTHTASCDQPVNYTAIFGTERLVSVTTAPEGLEVTVDGTTGIAPQAYWWGEGSSHELIAPTPQGTGPTRYAFASWSDGGARRHNVSVSGPRTYTADFATEHRVQIDSDPPGREIRVDGVPYALPQTFWWAPSPTRSLTVASPQAGLPGEQFLFEAWSDGAPRNHTLSVTGPMNLTATFRQQFRLTATSPYGTPYCDAPGCWYDAGDTAALQMNPFESGALGVRYRFLAWTGDVNDTRPVVPVLMDRPRTTVATWATEYWLQVISVLGSVSGEGWYSAGSVANFSVVRSELSADGKSYRFVRWTGDVNSTNVRGSFLMDGPKTAIANWEEIQFTDNPVVWTLPIVVAFLLLFLFWWLRRKRKKPEDAPDGTETRTSARTAQRDEPIETPTDADASPDLEDELDLDRSTER